MSQRIIERPPLLAAAAPWRGDSCIGQGRAATHAESSSFDVLCSATRTKAHRIRAPSIRFKAKLFKRLESKKFVCSIPRASVHAPAGRVRQDREK